MIPKVTVTCSSRVALGSVLILLLTTGCSCFPRLQQFHETALSHIPPRSALERPTVPRYYADVAFFGHHGTCWNDWPEGWVDCPCYWPSEVPTEELPLVPHPENVPDTDAEPLVYPAASRLPIPNHDHFPPVQFEAIAPASFETLRSAPVPRQGI